MEARQAADHQDENASADFTVAGFDRQSQSGGQFASGSRT
jgi:hypothetical protein